MKTSFRDSHSFEDRKKEAMKLKEKYQDKIPCIVEKAERSKIKDIGENRFLVNNRSTVGQFMQVIRKRLKLRPEEAIFLYINDLIPLFNNTMSDVYEQYKDEDGFLYMIYSGENTFGSN